MALDLEEVLLVALYIAIILFVTWLVAYVVAAAAERIVRRSAPRLARQVRWLAWVVVWLVGIMFAVQQLGIRVDLLLLLIGLGGAGLIIFLKIPLENLSAKYFSDLYLPFKAGDTVKVGDFSGKVIEINPMSTVLLDDAEQLVSLPNSVFLRQPLVNTTPQAWKDVTIPISLDRQLDVAEFERRLLKSCNKLRLHLDERLPPTITVTTRIPQSNELLLTLRIKNPGEKDVVVAEVNQRVAAVMDEMKKRS